MRRILNNPYFSAILFLILFGLIAFLPKIQHFGFYNDDWWQIYGAEISGVERFPEMYASDRPVRAYWHALLFILFGSKILPYQILAVFIRITGALGLFWTLGKVWQNNHKANFFISLIFLLYPGFLEQPNGFDYQIQQVALTSFIFSLGFSVLYFAKTGLRKLFYLLITFLLSLVTFSFMEYYIGLEIYRWLLLGSIYFRNKKPIDWSNLYRFIKKLIPTTFATVIFLIWRVFFFKSTRYTTDVGRIGRDFLESPLISILSIFRRWFGDIADVFLTVWVKRGYKNLSDLSSSEFISAIFLASVGVILFILFLKLSSVRSKSVSEKEPDERKSWIREALLVGFLGAIISLVPINLAEREVLYPIFNRFSLPSSIGVSLFFVALFFLLLSPAWRNGLIGLMIFGSMLSHFTNNTYYANRWIETQNFWQQWAWRVPGLAQGTMLAGFYPEPIQEGYFIWGPANLLYYADSPEISVGAEVLNNDTIKDIQMGNDFEKIFRTFYFKFSFQDSLIFTKPGTDTCLRFIDSNQPELSTRDNPLIVLAAPYSHINQISTQSTLNTAMFDKIISASRQPVTWCYLYQKASLARQIGDWKEIENLYNQALTNNLQPADSIEWFPFLQGLAIQGADDHLGQIAAQINETPYYRYQACQIFRNQDPTASPQVRKQNEKLAALFCTPD